MNNFKDPPIPKKIIIRKNTGIVELNLNVSNNRPSKRTIPNNIKSKSKKIPKDVSSSDEDSIDDDAFDDTIDPSVTNEIIKDVRSLINDTCPVIDKQTRINEINTKYEKSKKIYRTIKTSLKSIIACTSTHKKIYDIVSTMNKIVIHTYQFLKLYILYHYHTFREIPAITERLIMLIMKTIAKPSSSGIGGCDFGEANQIVMNNLKVFFEDYYKPTMSEHEQNEQLSYAGLTALIEYQATDILTNISNHLQEHFEDAIKRVIYIYFDKYDFCEKNKDNKQIVRVFMNGLDVLKEDIMTGSNKAIDDKYIQFKAELHKEVFERIFISETIIDACKHNPPQIVDESTKTETLRNIAEKTPLKLLSRMIALSIYSEKLSESKRQQMIREGKENVPQQVFAINCFPLRKNITPKYVTIDTKLILKALNDEGTSAKDMGSRWYSIWYYHFDLDAKVFKTKGYKFARQIMTDGVGCSILFIREDLYNDTKPMRTTYMKKPKCYQEEQYVDQLTNHEKTEALKLKIIGIDPGVIDLIAATDGQTTTRTKPNGKIVRSTPYYHYSNKERQHETKSNIYAKTQLELRKEQNIPVGNTLKSVEQIESELSNKSSSSCLWIKCYGYIMTKNRVNAILIERYEQQIYRKHKWYSYINNQKADRKMLKAFKEKMGGPQESVILIGDFDRTECYVKGQPPTKGISIRRLLRKEGYKVYLVNEYNTTHKLYDPDCELDDDGRDLVSFRGTRTPLALEAQSKEGLVPKELKTKSKKSSKPSKKKKEPFESIEIIKRDLNGSLNIRYKGICILRNEEVPKYMRRPNYAQWKVTSDSGRTT